ncbi:54S ribosomal protein L3 [Quaeritorhiza haematococci]|nr:54S ribosomal protein L3 [Quaeritorhiza haematococci]
MAAARMSTRCLLWAPHSSLLAGSLPTKASSVRILFPSKYLSSTPTSLLPAPTTTSTTTSQVLPLNTPLTGPIPPVTLPDGTKQAPKRTKKTKFRADAKEPPTPTFPMSDGYSATPELVYHDNARRVGMIGVKMGMTTMWDEWGARKAVTVIKFFDNEVIHTRYHPACGKWMVTVGAVNEPNLWKIDKPMLYYFRRFRIHPKRTISEFDVTPDACLPSGVALTSAHFVAGQYVDCQSTSKGKGFAGVMKRHGFSGLPATHGVSLAHRSMGSTGMRTTPGRVFKGKKMPGNMGNDTTTVQNLRILKVDPHEDLIYVAGHVPGAEGMTVYVRDAIKKLWAKKCFPVPNAEVPYPTFLEDASSLPAEMLPPMPSTEEELQRDPFLRQRRETD